MVFVKDEGSVFEASIDDVWRFLGAGKKHSEAHHHREVRRQVLSENSGVYSWKQGFMGKSQPFKMRWLALAPLGIAYEVLEGPFAGSKFFLYYTPKGRRTGVTVVGEFASTTISPSRLKSAVTQFFTTEFEQDSAVIQGA